MYETRPHARLRELRKADWRPHWALIVPVSMGYLDDDETHMLFYQRSNGFTQFYFVRRSGKISKISQSDWRSGWTHIVRDYVPSLNSSQHPARLFFYNATDGFAQYYSLDRQGRLRKVRDDNWGTGWTHILNGWSRNGDILFFYNKNSHLGRIYGLYELERGA